MLEIVIYFSGIFLMLNIENGYRELEDLPSYMISPPFSSILHLLLA